MATLDNLSIQALSSLSPEDAMRVILEVRLRRRRLPQQSPKRIARNLIDKLASLSDEQLRELQAQLAAKLQR